jgi:hypothetical protein
MDDDLDLAALEAAAWAEFEAALDVYMAAWSKRLAGAQGRSRLSILSFG